MQRLLVRAVKSWCAQRDERLRMLATIRHGSRRLLHRRLSRGWRAWRAAAAATAQSSGARSNLMSRAARQLRSQQLSKAVASWLWWAAAFSRWRVATVRSLHWLRSRQQRRAWKAWVTCAVMQVHAKRRLLKGCARTVHRRFSLAMNSWRAVWLAV